ncbi:hypothetical protein AMTR_s00032p00042710 [Amborella trichopoda]|uniref:Uncharacterized protein n=1 Tax=Amborella trichopoda TaxID=13333 RepID=U5D336_AMBTC|nr:hypothetical protein AMTR_s00032p00042710 [Amborella trichopoda]
MALDNSDLSLSLTIYLCAFHYKGLSLEEAIPVTSLARSTAASFIIVISAAVIWAPVSTLICCDWRA